LSFQQLPLTSHGLCSSVKQLQAKMPFICIGPVCVPWSCLPAIIFFGWTFVKPFLPEAIAKPIEAFGNRILDVIQPYLDKFNIFSKKKKSAAPATPEAAAAAAAAAESVRGGSVLKLESAAQLQGLIARSEKEGFGLVLDFTAEWCKPCQALKPVFHDLAGRYPSHIFVEVDADAHDDIVGDMGVMGLPTVEVIAAGIRQGAQTGVAPDKLVELVNKSLQPLEISSKKRS